ncbi:hypothetical protein BGW37DRAFT_518481 [Umbelopsis sp. PMI_123]|nr:hypothetical protein BGW37DRAFT_518481 [Umbelopsis sp. PMI_123]
MLEINHNTRDTIIWQTNNGFIHKTNGNQLVIVLEGNIQASWEFPSTISRVSCYEKLNSKINAFVLTTDGVLYKLEATNTLDAAKIQEPGRPAKRMKYTQESGKDHTVLLVSRDQVMTDTLAATVWIMAYTKDDALGCLVYHVDGSLIFWSTSGDHSVISKPQSVDSNYLTPNDHVCQLYLPIGPLGEAMHCNGKRSDGVVFGTSQGNIYYKAIDETSEVCIMDHPDTLHSIHPIWNSSNNAKNDNQLSSIVVLSVEGTATTVYITENSLDLQMDTMCLTPSATAAVSFMNRLYILDDTNALHKITFLKEQDRSQRANPVLVAHLSKELQVVDIGLYKIPMLNEPNVTELQAVLTDGNLVNIPISEIVPIHDEQFLQDKIQCTIQEIEKCRQSQNLLDNTHHFLNSLLSEYNMTIHKLQRILDMKSKSNLKSGAKPLFACNVKPKILPYNLRSLIPMETLLTIELQTEISIKWGENWRLCIELDPCSPVIEEPETPETVPGELLVCPLNDMRTSAMWERDFVVNVQQLGLPLYVNVSLAFFPLLSSVRDQSESSIDSQILFPVHGMILDMMSYALPCPSLFKPNTDFRGRKVTSKDIMEDGRDVVGVYASALKKTTGIALPHTLFLKVSTNTSVPTASHLVLLTLLSEGLDSQLLKEIMVDPEMAEFTLPLDRKIPVSVTVRQQIPQTSENHGLDIQIECAHPFILLKAFQAVAMRLSFNISENVQDMTDDIRNANATLHQDILRLQDLFQNSHQAKPQDIIDAYSKLSLCCQSLDLGTMLLEDSSAKS